MAEGGKQLKEGAAGWSDEGATGGSDDKGGAAWGSDDGAAGGSDGTSAKAARDEFDLGYFDADPMEKDFFGDFGIRDVDDPGMIASGQKLFNQTKTRDIPCKFHDGVSGKCWKGSSCPYGHELLTGGLFAEQYPELALAQEARRAGLYSYRLPVKPTLVKEAEIFGEITYVEDPSEFYVRPLKNPDGSCSCAKIREWIPMLRREEQNEDQWQQLQAGDDALGWEAYCLSSVEPDPDSPAVVFQKAMEGGPSGMPGKKIDDLLNEFLRSALNYKRYQEDWYQPLIELIAVRVNHKWRRAYVRPGINIQEDPVIIRAQLLETGETVNVGLGDVCKLPEKFVDVPAGAFKCSLFGMSPVWGIWSEGCISYFKELTRDKNLKIIVKRGPCRTDGIQLFEMLPYSVQVMFESEDQKWIDVARAMNQAGHGLPWNLIPKRPFSNTVIEAQYLDFLSQSFQEVSLSALEIENERLVYGYEYDSGECDSDNPSCDYSGGKEECFSDEPTSTVYYSGEETCRGSERSSMGEERGLRLRTT